MNTTLEGQFLGNGETVDFVSSGGDTEGDVIAVGGMMGIVLADVADTATGSAAISGEAWLRKITGALAVGDVVGWDNNGSPQGGTALSGAATSVRANCDVLGATVLEAAGSSDEYVRVVLNKYPASYTIETLFTDANSNEVLAFTSTSGAVNYVTLANSATANPVTFTATGDDTNISVTIAGKGTGAINLGQATSTGVKLVADQPILDSAGLELIKFTATATAVNEITVANAATGNAPTIAATGETNVPLIVKAKGTGTLTLGQATGKVQIATAATDYVGLYDATPVVRANHIADPSGGATNDAEARTAINAILTALENLGVLKTS